MPFVPFAFHGVFADKNANSLPTMHCAVATVERYDQLAKPAAYPSPQFVGCYPGGEEVRA